MTLYESCLIHIESGLSIPLVQAAVEDLSRLWIHDREVASRGNCAFSRLSHSLDFSYYILNLADIGDSPSSVGSGCIDPDCPFDLPTIL